MSDAEKEFEEWWNENAQGYVIEKHPMRWGYLAAYRKQEERVRELESMIDDGWRRSVEKAIAKTVEANKRAEQAEARVRELENIIAAYETTPYRRV